MPRIYVASLSDYNAGHLHGAHIDLDGLDENDVDTVQEQIAEMLRGSKYPNVLVECPTCEEAKGEHVFYSSDHMGSIWMPCKTCNATGKVPSAEEWAVHDYDDLPSSFGEYPDLAKLLEYVRCVEEHGDAWVAYMEDQRHNSPSEDDFNERYAGEASDERGWIYGHVEDSGLLSEMPEHLRHYFDYDAYLRSMTAGGEVTFESVNGTTYAFWNY